MKHTIVGAGGAIGNALAAELLAYKEEEVRLVSRSNYSIGGTVSVKADVTSYPELVKSIEGSDVVYLCPGLSYDAEVWAASWPKIMQNTIDACKSVHAKLIFFDNVYMYGKVQGKMTEETPYNPCSKKGEIRAKIALQLEEEMKQKNLNAIIARSADFYGPHALKTSILYMLVIENLMKGKSAQWIVNENKPHSFTYTLDCGKGLYLLSKNEACYNQVWHLPTSDQLINGKMFIELIAKELGKKPNYMVLKKWMLKTYGLFDKTVKEMNEMLYQYDSEYHFDSTKFNAFFNFKPTIYEQGISETIDFVKKQKV
jgi:nucleoside-diphosphate-sugar epimerase